MSGTARSSEFEVRVERQELLRYLTVLSKSMSSKNKVAQISFNDGWLMIAAGEADFAIAAEGRWGQPVSIDASWIPQMTRLLPAGNPLVLRVEKKQFFINSFGVPCHEVTNKKTPDSSKIHSELSNYDFENQKPGEKQMNEAEMKAELERLRAENAQLKTKEKGGITLKVSEKGAVSLYGMGKFPVTLYKEQWLRILASAPQIEAFIRENDAKLKTKE
jgi:hypothetical protein